MEKRYLSTQLEEVSPECEYYINGDDSTKVLFKGGGYVRYRSYEVTEINSKTITFQGNAKISK